MKRALVIGAFVLASCGCVTAPLEHYTLHQSLSVADMRYQEVMNVLATVAANQGTLPSYALAVSGVANVTASVTLESTTDWTRAAHNFASQVLSVGGNHNPDLSWTLDPVAEPPLLAGAWYACRWAIWGPPSDPDEFKREYNLLRKPEIDRYRRLPSRGPERNQQDVSPGRDGRPAPDSLRLAVHRRPLPAARRCYQAHCGDTYVWVTPEGLQGLSEFTLVLVDIATTDPSWLAQQKQQATVSVDLSLPGAKDSKSTITETWSACQVEEGGVTKIVVTPFAEPAPLGTSVPTWPD